MRSKWSGINSGKVSSNIASQPFFIFFSILEKKNPHLFFRQWAPLASGRLARRPTDKPASIRSSFSSNGSIYVGESQSTNSIIARIEEIATERKWPMSHVALAWLNRRVTAPVIGFGSVEHLDETLAANGKELTEAEEEYLEQLYEPRSVQGHS